MTTNLETKVYGLLGKAALLLKPYRVFDLFVGIPKHDSYEDPKCPLQWRGSGCYNIDVYGWDYERFRVCARTEEEAESLFLAWCESEYKRIYNDCKPVAKNYRDERRAIEKAEEGGYRDCPVLGLRAGKPSEGVLKHKQLVSAGKAEGKWSRNDDDTELEDALEAFGYVNKRKHPTQECA